MQLLRGDVPTVHAVVTYVAQSYEVLRCVGASVFMVFDMVQLKQDAGVTFPLCFVRPFALFASMLVPFQD